MGKPTGFLDYKRKEQPNRPVCERVRDWNDIKLPVLPEKDTLQNQAARCMDCSIPFCHSGVLLNNTLSGCPLHNLMPEFNDFLCQGLEAFAYARLNKTNNFPEFTSHVCPAPCEGACSAGLVAEPVTIKNIEQYLSEYAFANELVKPVKPLRRSGRRVAVVGSGPAGLACADELNKAGHAVVVYEKSDRPGGLLMYGIPNMKLDKFLVTRRIGILEASGIQFCLNSEVGSSISAEMLCKEFDAVVLCTGSTTPRDLDLPGRSLSGIHFAKEYLEAATKAFLNSQPLEHESLSAKGKDVVVLGGGDTGTDCVATAIRQGCRSIRQIEIMPCLPGSRQQNNPWPEFPRLFKTDYGQGEAIEMFGTDPRSYCLSTKEFIGSKNTVEGLRICRIEWKNINCLMTPCEIPKTEETIPAQLVLLALGFTGTAQKVFEEFKLDKTRQNNIQANEKDFSTNVKGVFAAGDSRRGQSLVVWAIAEGREAAKAVCRYLKG